MLPLESPMMRSVPNFSNDVAARKKTTSKKGELSTPIFLRKAFDMISTCDPTLACWSDDGATFIIKEPEMFASRIIPSYFKHSNMSSFVRQLNFYGFRKIKSDPLRLREAALSEESRFWKFGHRYFIQGREDLLLEIKKDKDRNDTPKGTVDLEHLKRDNANLKRKLSHMTRDVEDLKAALPPLMQQIESFTKKPRSSGPTPSQKGHSSVDLDDLSLGCIDEDLLLSLYDGSAILSNNNEQGIADYSVARTAHLSNLTTVELAEGLRRTLSRLPSFQQTQLVDRLVRLICHPEELQRQTDAVVTSHSMTTKAVAVGSGSSDNPNQVDKEKYDTASSL